MVESLPARTGQPEPSARPARRWPTYRWLRRALDLLWLLALAVYVLAGIRLVPHHGDESTYIFMSSDYHYLFYDHDIHRLMYHRQIADDRWVEQYLRLINGTVNKMLIGLSWDIAGLTIDDLNQPWNWNFYDPSGQMTQWDWNLANGRVPTDRLLWAARWPSSLLTVVAVWAIFGIAWLVGGAVGAASSAPTSGNHVARLTAYAASLIYVTHPDLLLNGRRAMTEGSMMAFMALTVLAGLLMLRAAQRRETSSRTLWLWAILLGVLAGTALSSKHTALLVVVPVYAVLLARAVGPYPPAPFPMQWRKGRRSEVPLHRVGRDLGWGQKAEEKIWVMPSTSWGWGKILPPMIRLGVSGAVVCLTFLLWNPAWWSFDHAVVVRIVHYRQELLNWQCEAGRADGTTYTSLLERAQGLVNSLFWDGPQYYEVPRWSSYKSSGLAGRLGGPVWAVLGYGALAAGLVRAVRSWRAAEVRLVLVWGAVVTLGLYLLTPLDWARYYLPLQAPAAVFAGLGAAALLNAAGLVSGAVRRVTTRWRMGDAHG